MPGAQHSRARHITERHGPRQTRKPLCPQGHRGFESLPLHHSVAALETSIPALEKEPRFPGLTPHRRECFAGRARSKHDPRLPAEQCPTIGRSIFLLRLCLLLMTNVAGLEPGIWVWAASLVSEPLPALRHRSLQERARRHRMMRSPAPDECFASLPLGIQGIEVLLETFLGRLAGVDGALASVGHKPKNLRPDQRAPVIARAISEIDRYRRPS